MRNYDGPSFYKKDQPKLKPIRENKKNRFESNYQKTIPKQVQTRDELKKEAFDYMETPSVTSKSADEQFRRKGIPSNWQNLEGWQKTKKNQSLIDQIKAQLTKEKESYLLFAEYLDDDGDAESQTEQSKKRVDKQKRSKNTTTKQKKQPSEETQAKNQAERVKEKVTSPVTKPTSGLHRSLSKIIAEDQEAMQNGKNSLNSLFSADK